MLKTMTVRTAIAAMLAGLSVSAHAIADTQRIDIPAGSLLTALETLAKQANIDLVYQDAQVRGFRTSGVTGELSPHDAVVKLLEGTPLRVRKDEASGAILIMMPPSSAPARSSSEAPPSSSREDRAEESRPSFWSRLRLAQSSPSQGGSAGESTTSADENSPQSLQRVEVEEVIVTGSRLTRTTEEGPAPVIVFDRETIERLGATSVGAVLDYLPQQPAVRQEQQSAFGDRAVNLRGLGFGTTLVLINGRRTVTSALQASGNYFDLNTIPLAAVQRIEVLSDSASAVYGADAVGGVVNVVLKDRIDRPTFDLYYGKASGGAEERRGSAAFGHTADRVQVAATLDAYDREFLLGSERALYADQDFRRFGSSDRRSLSSNPANISSTTADNLPGLPSRFATVPQGSSGVDLTPESFLPTAGTQNWMSLAQYLSILPEARRLSGNLLTKIDVTDQVTAFAELSYTNGEVTSRAAPPTLSNVEVPATNPFNPFGVPVSVSYLLTGLGPRESISETQSLRVVAGAEGTFSGWNWEFSALRTDDDGSFLETNILDMSRVNAALAATDPAQALNVFQDGPGGSAALLSSLVAEPVLNDDSSQATQFAGHLRRDLFTVQGQPAQFLIGAETRSENVHFELNTAALQLDADRRSSAVYSEIRLPVLAGSSGGRLAPSLVATVAARYDDYDDFGSTFNPQFGLEWRFGSPLLLRASYGTSFRPPSLYQLYLPRSTRQGFAFDPRRNNEFVPIDLTTGGNPDLDAEEADSLVLGFVLMPALDGLKIGASYWRITYERQVRTLNPLSDETLFGDRVVRAAPTPGDVAAGLPGRLVSVDFSSVNFGTLKTSGVDFELSAGHRTRFGQFFPRLAATWVERFEQATVPGESAVERVGIADVAGTIPRWRATASLAWSFRGAELSATARWTASYQDAVFGVQTGREIPSQTLLDLQASLDVAEFLEGWSSVLDGITLRAGVRNALNETPHFSEVAGSQGLGIDLSQADPVQRFSYVSISKSF